MATTTASESGGALGVNLARTAVEVVIPDEHAVLLEITSGWLGVQGATRDLLREVHHRYVGWRQVLDDIHRRAMGDLHRLNAHERGAEALGVYCDLYAMVVERAGDEQLRSDATRRWLMYLTAIATRSGGRLERNVPVLRAAMARLARLLEAGPATTAAISPGLKRLARALAEAPPAVVGGAAEDALALLAYALEETYRRWTAQPDPGAWYRQVAPEGWGTDLPERVARISHERLRLRAAELAAAVAAEGGPRARAERLLALPDDSQIARAHLEAAEAFTARDAGRDPTLARIHWLLRVLGHPLLGVVQDAALRDVGRLCSRLLGEPGDREGLVREVFRLLRRGDLPQTRAFTDLVAQLGGEVMSRGEPRLASVLVDEMLELGVAHPRFGGYTDEWGVRVDPAHLRGVRAHLAVIGAGPALARRLIAGLVAHLRLGGVFIADTDLFQRDVSTLLARDIGPAYLYVKQLLRVFPVYFSEIGAEGELRATSTRLDELAGRRDPLCHLLRKQSHVECNPRLIPFAEEIVRYWATGDTAGLAAYVPESIGRRLAGGGDGEAAALCAVTAAAAELAGGVEALLALEPHAVAALRDEVAAPDPVAGEKLELIFRVRAELRRKYALDHADVLRRLRGAGAVGAGVARDLERAMAEGRHDAALELVMQALEALRVVVLRPGEPAPVEDIYLKRHIAVGIPSMYGSYREERLDAVGLILRLESLATALFERVIDDEPLERPNRGDMRRVAGWLRLLMRALRTDGYRAQGLAHCVAMLDEAVERPGVRRDQYRNVFQLMSRNIEGLVRARILDVYEEPARRACSSMVREGVLARAPGESEEESVLKHVEALERELIAESFGLSRLDLLVGRLLHALADGPDDEVLPGAVAGRRPPHAVRIGDRSHRRDGIVALGNKGYMLTRLADLGFRVPAGFVLSIQPGRDDGGDERLAALVSDGVARLERDAGGRFGDPARPLLLSVRGGAPISMPGMLESFLNVGASPEVVAGLAASPGRAWSAWDAYRRFLQLWGMSDGIPRERFDALIRGFKHRHAVEKKALLAAGQMAELAGEYRALILAEGVSLIDEPFAQLMECVRRVRRSWDSDRARLYRAELGISDGWGTGVVVQAMVFGNLGMRSGTGVMLTRPPSGDSDAAEPYGDFILKAQGDDVVGGLVETFPLGERQRLAERRTSPVSLERSFPEIHAALADLARTLVEDVGMNHQEVEFTFEGDRRDELYVLQTRDMVTAASAVLPAFLDTPALRAARIAGGIGVGGGALSGRAAHRLDDIDRLRARFPDDPVILLRRDTVPDDIPAVLRSDGLLTAVGGVTSHAAVAAKRLGKTCVVGARPFDVDGDAGPSRMGRWTVRTGDLISINGIDGSVHLGAHDVIDVPVRGRAQQ
ncbi:PEP/pyruvate-binding domain-containing protein [Miltoncostaea marina]|uniref:PEP/pyruvate-binding domain-containing protein n=1 Tax=Miltoncostaea marina TaxID=2843215 RepID=UPI001C3E145D|nr:PEP/pyruvate-binding domain-containing protein [Miltoncostaea marina]